MKFGQDILNIGKHMLTTVVFWSPDTFQETNGKLWKQALKVKEIVLLPTSRESKTQDWREMKSVKWDVICVILLAFSLTRLLLRLCLSIHLTTLCVSVNKRKNAKSGTIRNFKCLEIF